MSVLISSVIINGVAHHMNGIQLAAAACFFQLEDGSLYRIANWNRKARSYDVIPTNALTLWGDLPIFSVYRTEDVGHTERWVVKHDDHRFRTPHPGGALAFGRIQYFCPSACARKTVVLAMEGWVETAEALYIPESIIEVHTPEELIRFLPVATAVDLSLQ